MLPWVHSIHQDVIYGWAGTIASIPKGFSLCDGTNGTPDLTDRFIVGAGNDFAVSDVGGSVKISHDFTGAGHTHDADFGSGINTGINRSLTSNSVQITGTTGFQSTVRPPFYALVFLKETGL